MARFLFDSIANSRELGGYSLPDGTVKSRMLLRGGSLAEASEEDLRSLHDDYNIRRVFDFRTLQEVRLAPDRDIIGAMRLWLPAIDPETEMMSDMSLPKEAYRDLGRWLCRNASNPMVQSIASRLYTDMVVNEYTQLQYAAFFQTILDAPADGGIFWHCSQGKDRTGLGAAFLLYALGADRDLVMQDYLISNEFYRDQVEQACNSVATEEEREVMRTFIGVNPRYFEAALDLIDKRYGSMRAYIKGPLCVSDDDISVLKNRYLE